MSTAMMRDALARVAPWTALNPTAPRPKIATVQPGSTLAVFNTAPIPVVIPQASRQTLSSGAAGLILVTAISGRTVY